MSTEQKAFVQAVERLYARVSRLRDVAYGNDWDKYLADAWLEYSKAVNDAIPAYADLQ